MAVYLVTFADVSWVVCLQRQVVRGACKERHRGREGTSASVR
jgi:hypothetical protein